MAELDLNSLFGQDPRLLQQAMDMQMAKASPEERLYMMGAQGGRALGQGIGSLFGVDVQDPMMKKAAALRALASEYDTTTVEGMTQFAQAASKIDPRAGFLAAQQVRDMQAKQAGIAKDVAAAQASTATAAAGRLTPEQRNAAGIADTKAERGTPEWTSTYNAELVRLTTKPEARINYGEEANRVAVATFGKPFAELTQEQARQVDQTLERRGITKAAASRTTLNLPPQEKAEQGKRGEFLVDQYKDVSKQAAVATRTLPALESTLNILDKGFDTGFGTETIAAGAKILAALGVDGAKDFATSAQSFLGAASQAVLTRQLEQKGPQTESDAQRITQTGAQLGNTKEANRFLVSVAKAQFKRDIAQRNFFDSWWKKNKTYDGAEDAWYAGEGGRSLFDYPELRKYRATEPTSSQIPTQRGTAATTIYARNPQTNERIMSTDGGKTWQPAR